MPVRISLPLLLKHMFLLLLRMSVFKMSSVDDKPTSILFSEDCFSLSKEDKMTTLQLEIGNVIDEYF